MKYEITQSTIQFLVENIKPFLDDYNFRMLHQYIILEKRESITEFVIEELRGMKKEAIK